MDSRATDKATCYRACKTNEIVVNGGREKWDLDSFFFFFFEDY